jgi:hypothetical protein
MNITSALSAAIALIGGDGPGTIRLPAGTFYVSTMLYIGAGYGRGICLQGAGKNATIIKAAAGFSSQYFMTFGPLSKASGLTFDTAGATLGQGEAIVCPTMTDVAVIARGYLCVKGDGGSFAFTNCDFIGRGVFLTMPTQAIVSGCNFYGTDGTDALFYVWSGNNISFKNNTGQDFNAASSNPTDRAKGRFFVGSGIWGTQSNIYLGENRTINFSQPAGWGDQNTGETFMWEGNWGTLSSLVSSATAITARLATLTGDYVGREAVIVGGKGIGQHRTILATDFASGGGTLTLDRPWDVIPDATTRINIVTTIKRVAIYRNTLEGNGNLQQGSASSGVETFQGGMDFVVDSNTMSRFRWGINDFAYNDTSGTCAQPLFGNIYLNNIISNCAIGIRSVDCGNSYGEQATFLGHIYRNNTLSGIQITHWLITAGFSSLGKTMDLVIFEHNRAADAPVGISFYQPAQVGQIFLSLYKNTIDRGAAPASGSQPVSPQNGFVVLSRGDLFLNYLAGQNPFGPINALSPPFAWNAIYGAHHYVVSVTDLTTGQGPIQYNTTATSWTPSQALAKGHRYRWSVMAMTADAPLTNGSVPLDLAVSVPTQSTVSFATQTLVSGNSTVLTITIKDSAGNPIPGLVNSDFVLALVGGSSAGTFGPVSETATPGTYVTTFTATTSGSTATLNVTVNGVLLSGHPTMSVGGGSTFADNFSAAGANQQLLSPWVNQVGSFLVNTTTGTANAVSGLNLATVSSVSAADEMVSAVVTLAVGQVAGLVARHTGPGDLNMYHGVLSAGAGNYTAMILRNLNGGIYQQRSA